MEKVHSHIAKAISRKKGGGLLFPKDFQGVGSSDAIKKAFSRLSKMGAIKRLSHGIYYVPKQDPILGELPPSTDEVVRSLAAKEKIRIRPTGASALHKLGLTTQVPTKMVFLTDGAPRNFKIGKLRVEFKATTPKKLSTQGPISHLVILALEELGTDSIPSDVEEKIYELLKREKAELLKKDLTLAPAKISDYIIKLLKRKQDDRLVTAH